MTLAHRNLRGREREKTLSSVARSCSASRSDAASGRRVPPVARPLSGSALAALRSAAELRPNLGRSGAEAPSEAAGLPQLEPPTAATAGARCPGAADVQPKRRPPSSSPLARGRTPSKLQSALLDGAPERQPARPLRPRGGGGRPGAQNTSWGPAERLAGVRAPDPLLSVQTPKVHWRPRTRLDPVSPERARAAGDDLAVR